MVDREDIPSKGTALLRTAMEVMAASPRSLDMAARLLLAVTALLLLNTAVTALTNSLRRSMEDTDRLRADTTAASSINIPVRITRLQASIPTAILSTLRPLRTRELARRRLLPPNSLAMARRLAIHSSIRTVREGEKLC